MAAGEYLAGAGLQVQLEHIGRCAIGELD